MQRLTRLLLTLGLAGVYGSFMLHSERAAERYGVSQAEILLEAHVAFLQAADRAGGGSQPASSSRL